MWQTHAYSPAKLIKKNGKRLVILKHFLVNPNQNERKLSLPARGKEFTSTW
jgi:hypothetical protein